MPERNLLHVDTGGNVSLDSKCSNCHLCNSPRLQTNCMSGVGPKRPTFMVVGYSPSIAEDARGEPFSEATGMVLKHFLTQADINPASVRFSNTVRCAAFSEKPKDSVWKKCRPHFKNELEEVQPRAIITLGAAPFRWLTNVGNANKFRRKGFPCAFDKKITVFPFQHPQILNELDDKDAAHYKSQFVSDLMWLRNKALSGNLSFQDNIKKDYKRAKTVQDVKDFLSEFPKGTLVYCDLETATANYDLATYPYPGNLIASLGFSNGPGHARTIPYKARGIKNVTYWSDEELAEIKELLREFFLTHQFIGHNFIQFDQKWIEAEWGIGELDIPFEPMLQGHLLNEEPGFSGLEVMALMYTDMQPWKSQLTVKDTIRMCNYLAQDLDAGSRLWPVVQTLLSPKQHQLHTELQVPLAKISRRMEQRGIRIDVDAMNQCGEALEFQIAEAESEIRKSPHVQAWQLKTGKAFNGDSPHDVRELMRDFLKLPQIKSTETGLYSTDAEVLEHYEDEVDVIGAILRRRRSAKLKSTYVDAIRERVEAYGDRVNYSIRWNRTVTGRPAGENPNVFNIPRPDTAEKSGIKDPSLIKSMFVPAKGRILLQADFSQAELRVLAALSGDPALRQAYLDGVDVHTATAAQAYGVPLDQVTKSQRTNAKAINFGIVYGKSERSLAQDFVNAARMIEKKAAKAENRPMNFTKEMEEEARAAGEAALRAHKQAHPGVWRYLAKQERLMKTNRVIETPFGRRRHFKRVDNRAMRQAYNFQIQSVGSGDLTHEAIIRTDRVFREADIDAFAVLTVYDSIIFSVTIQNLWRVAEIAKRVMEGLDYPWLTVPMKVDLEAGYSWGRLKTLCLETRTVLK